MTRLFDILFSFIAIIISMPVMLPIMIALKFTGEHYIFYRQKRVGRKGKDFYLFKFATMLLDSPNLRGGLYTDKNDPRMLPMGKFLRRTKINELPQLINIFIGQMSFVGFRPTVRQHFEGYPDYAKEKLQNAMPGLTGIGSVVFRNEEEILQNFADKKAFHQNVIAPYKAALECWYIDHAGLFNYFKLIMLTAVSVLRPSSSIWRTWFRDLPPVPPELAPYV
jgi:lipopolysaccharide/colanic/teichoic acid biosynthesis glycosyltransferase